MLYRSVPITGRRRSVVVAASSSALFPFFLAAAALLFVDVDVDVVVVSGFSIAAPAARSKDSRSSPPSTTTSFPRRIVCARRISNDDDGDRDRDYGRDIERDGTAASVGDYVKGVHGEKYNFGVPGGPSAAAQEFTQALYSSSSSVAEEEQDSDDDEPMPRWAQNMGATTTSAGAAVRGDEDIRGTLVLGRGREEEEATIVTITNRERTWEPFYAKLVVPDDNDWERIVRIEPRKGTLAPRGGSANVCDPNRPYSDSATIRVSLRKDEEEESIKLSSNDDDEQERFLLLAIGTEEEKWYYRVLIRE